MLAFQAASADATRRLHATYRTAWCYQELGQTQLALETLDRVVQDPSTYPADTVLKARAKADRAVIQAR